MVLPTAMDELQGITNNFSVPLCLRGERLKQDTREFDHA